MRRFDLEVVARDVPAILAALVVQPTLLEQIKERQSSDPYLQKVRCEVKSGRGDDFAVGSDGALRFRNRLCMPKDEEIQKAILQEAHQSPYSVHPGKLQSLPIPVWKWENIAMDFIVGLSCSQTGHDTIWVIVDRLTKSAHFLPIHATWSGDKLAQVYLDEIEAEEKVRLVRQRLLTAQSRQHKHRKNLEFAVGDRVFLKVSPMRGIKRFGV
ncbi:uncharacterized protein LOC109720150 [Ananas comosus]|uniref:Uncharacterized protein LOC109720150 n=1 Tax=Ananas comosus TaxID=4615 RepID=A0A6P5G208_ANACO|nr:uncharacterized protein LOC109720150 [Ananas comosus]